VREATLAKAASEAEQRAAEIETRLSHAVAHSTAAATPGGDPNPPLAEVEGTWSEAEAELRSEVARLTAALAAAAPLWTVDAALGLTPDNNTNTNTGTSAPAMPVADGSPSGTPAAQWRDAPSGTIDVQTQENNERTLRRLEQIRSLKEELSAVKTELAGVKTELPAVKQELAAVKTELGRVDESRKERALALRSKTVAYIASLREEQAAALASAEAAWRAAVEEKQNELGAYRAAAAEEVARAMLSGEVRRFYIYI